MSFRIVLAIARKDVVDAVRNLYLLFGIVFPIGMWLLFKVIMPSGPDFTLGALAVFDEGSSKLVERLSADPLVERVIAVQSLDELTETVRKAAVGGIAIPAGFDEAVAAEQSPTLTVYIDGRRVGGEQVALRRLIDQQARQLAARPAAANLVERDVSDPARVTDGSPFNFESYTLILLLILSLAMTGTFVVPTLLVEEKEKLTLRAILVSPASHRDVVAGKALVGLFYSLAGAGVLLALNDGLRGDLVLLGLTVVLGALFMVEAGLLLGALFNTMSQVNTWSSVLMLVLIAPSWTISIRVPAPVETALGFLPTYHLGQLLRAARGSPAEANILTAIAVLAGSSAVLFVLIAWSLRRMER